MHNVLVLGGYGNFGAPICRVLSQDSNIRLWVAGRNEARAESFAQLLDSERCTGVVLDCQSNSFSRWLINHAVDTVINTAGPFQGQNYAVAEQCIDAGCNYIDLADGQGFVSNIRKLDAKACERGVLVVSGASSVPALSAAVVDRFLPEFGELHEIRHGISSGAKTPGLATLQAVLGYCGKPIRRLDQATWQKTFGWQDLHVRKFPPPVGRRLLGSCEVPDLALFPERYENVKAVVFHAGVGNSMSHLSTWALTWLVRWGLLKSLLPFAGVLKRVSEWIEPLGTDRSAMYVELRGLDKAGQSIQKEWCLLAFDNHGPEIPCGGSIALVRKIAAGGIDESSAMPCLGLLTLDEYLGALSHLNLKQVLR